MKAVIVASIFSTLFTFSSVSQAQEGPKPPTPVKEHEWLQKLAGEWETKTEAMMEPGKPPMKCVGVERVRDLGGLWIMGEYKGSFMETPMTGVMTLGYDIRKKKFVGTWICSMCDQICQYEGTLDPTGKILTLKTEMANPMTGKLAKCKDVMELKSNNHRVLTSYILGEDGKWTQFMTMESRRKN